MAPKAPRILTLDLLVELEGLWGKGGAPVLEHLRPGLASDEIDTLTEPLGVRLPTEARTWWGWHDGVAGSVPLGAHRELGPGLPFLPLEEAAALYLHALQQAAEVAGDQADYWWRPSWFPVTERRGEIRCDCSVQDGSATPIYWAYSHDHDADGLTDPKVESFGTMVQWWIEALQSGAWRYHKQSGRWERDTKLLPPERDASGLV
jgi:SMI1/KNR4 family protein SUKH-1